MSDDARTQVCGGIYCTGEGGEHDNACDFATELVERKDVALAEARTRIASLESERDAAQALASDLNDGCVAYERRIAELESERDAARVESAGADARARLVLGAKNAWGDRARQAEARLSIATKALEEARAAVASHDCRGSAEIRKAFAAALASLHIAPPPAPASPPRRYDSYVLAVEWRRKAEAALEALRGALEEIATRWHCAADGCPGNHDCEHKVARRALSEPSPATSRVCGDVPAPMFGGPCTREAGHDGDCGNGGEWRWKRLSSPPQAPPRACETAVRCRGTRLIKVNVNGVHVMDRDCKGCPDCQRPPTPRGTPT